MFSHALPLLKPQSAGLRRKLLLLIYFILAFGIKWAVWIPQASGVIVPGILTVVAGFGPSIAGLILIYFDEGKEGLHNTAYRLISNGRFLWKWMLLCVVAPVLCFLLGLAFYYLLCGEIPQLVDPAHVVTSPGQWYLGVLVFLYIFIFSALGEEIGWRGYALPRLLIDWGSLRASLILGICWFIWHLPLFWIAGNFHQQLPWTWFFLQIMGMSLLYTWFYHRTQGNLFIAMLFHTSGNAAVGLLPVLPADVQGSTLPLWITVIILWVIVAIILYRRSLDS